MVKIVVTEPNTTVYVGNNDIVEINIPGGGAVTIKAESSSVNKFKVFFKGDNQSDTASIDLATFAQNDLHIDIQHYDPTDTVELIGGFNKGVDPDNDDEFSYSYIGATGNTFNGFVHAKDGGESDFNADPSPIIICFAKGTTIDTDLGPRPVESLVVSDLVRTQGNGMQPVRWIGKRQLDSIDLTRHPQLCPVHVAPGALGRGKPYKKLVLSPQHRVQFADWRAEYLFGQASVLTAIKYLVNDHSITVDYDAASVCYYHLLFDRHEMVSANGTWAESLHPGEMAMDALDSPTKTELNLVFPELQAVLASRKTAAMVLKSHEAFAIRGYAA
ncbi:MAG: Hint domain-containing protein [Rhodobacter sp.]|nr:Hint domain-containing protein [Rhodobacter sp.]